MNQPTMTLTVTGPAIVLDQIRKALNESEQTLICPDSIAPGYLVHASETQPTSEQDQP
jgi:hypothetical protein